MLVSGIFPVGCIALFLAKFETQNAAAYDPETGCLKWLNEFSQHHNLLLRRELRRLRRAHPHSTIIYDDIYRALMAIYTSPSQFGEPQTAAASRDYEFISPWLSDWNVGAVMTSTLVGVRWRWGTLQLQFLREVPRSMELRLLGRGAPHGGSPPNHCPWRTGRIISWF